MNYRKKPLEQIPEEDTAIWACTMEGCKGWMRDNFSFEETPICPLCQSVMVQDTRMLPLLANWATDKKSGKKGVGVE